MNKHALYSYNTETLSMLSTQSNLSSDQQIMIDNCSSLLYTNSSKITILENNYDSTLFFENYRENLYSNAIINGGMEVAQRSAISITNAAPGAYVCDRFSYQRGNTIIRHTISLSDNDAPPSTYGLSKSMKLDCTTANASPGATEYCYIRYAMEGYDAKHFYDKTFTVGFWVKAPFIGTYCVAFRNSGATRSYVSEYTIISSNTWEYKTVTCVHTSSGGTWLKDKSLGLEIAFTLAAGSDYKGGTNNTWVSSDEFATSNQGNACASTAYDFYLTGVQMNLGATALPYIPRHYSEELKLCQRYYYMVSKYDGASKDVAIGHAFSTDAFHCYIQLPVTMRDIPTLSVGINNYQVATNTALVASITSISSGTHTENILQLILNKAASFTITYLGHAKVNAAGAYVAANAEL